MAIGISAMGRKGTFPKGSVESGDVRVPYGTDRAEFIAAFSNIGSEIDLTGPGVGVISTVPGGHATMSGTSMACPGVTGAAARTLSSRKEILEMPRDQARSDAMANALLTSGALRGFGGEYEGHGLPKAIP
jgi:subtilisin